MDKLVAIVTGPERNGTTYLKQIIDSHPLIYSGFETGLLCQDDFSQVKPFCEWIHHGNQHWGIKKDVDFSDPKLSMKDKFELLYKYKATTNLVNGENKSFHQNLLHKAEYIIDKTPRYFRDMEFLVKNVPCEIPILVTIKYLKQWYHSVVVKRHLQIKTFQELVDCHMKNLQYIKDHKFENVYIFSYDDICMPSFQDKLKTILSNRIDCDGIELSFENFLKKMEGNNYVYDCYKKEDDDYGDLTLPDGIKELEETYNKLIDEVKTSI